MGVENPNGVATPEMLNAIRSEASQAYKDSVPEATLYNLQEVGNPILEYEAAQNEFMTALANKIAFPLIERKMWKNPLGALRTSQMPLGTDVEEPHVNPVVGENYDGGETGMADLLKMHKPDVAAVYYRLNRQEKYPATINNQQLRGAFTSWSNMENFIAFIVDSIYNGATIDDYKYAKQLLSNAIAANQIVMQQVVYPNSEATGKQFMKTVRGLSMNFTFPGTQYNSYKKIGGAGNPRVTWADIDDQILLIRGDVAAGVGVDVLATLFNLEFGNYLTKNIIVDNFNDETTLGVLCDKRAFVIMEQLRQFATFWNPSSLGWQYFYHVWDLFALSPFHNMVALTTANVTP